MAARPKQTPATPPPGAYANSCVAREAMFHYFSRTRGTPGRIIRLNYAIDMRYGVLHDVATRVLTGQAINLETGHVNVIWQGDANSMVLRALGSLHDADDAAQCQRPRNRQRALARRDVRPALRPAAGVRRRRGAGRLAGQHRRRRCGCSAIRSVSLARLIDWTADWVGRDMPALGKDTHYDTRDGQF